MSLSNGKCIKCTRTNGQAGAGILGKHVFFSYKHILKFYKNPHPRILVSHQRIHLFSNGSMVAVELLRLVSSPKSQLTWGQSERSQPLRARKLGLTTSHGVSSLKSQVWHGCLHGNMFWRWGEGLVLRVGSSLMLKPTLNISHENFSHK